MLSVPLLWCLNAAPAQATQSRLVPSDDSTVTSIGSGDASASASAAAPTANADAPADSAATPVYASRASRAFEPEATRQPFGLAVTFGNIVGTGSFARNEALRRKTGYIGQTWDIAPYLGFSAFGHWLKLSASLLLDIGYTRPDTTSGRRVDPHDARLSLSDSALYSERLSGITFSGFLRGYLPTSYESLQVRRQWGGLGVGLGASRTIGAFDLRYTASFAKYFNSSPVATQRVSAVSETNAAYVSSRHGDTLGIPAGYGNPSFAVSNEIEIACTVSRLLAVSYAVALVNSFNYKVAPTDEYTSAYSDGGRGRRDQLAPTLAVTYGVGGAFRDSLPSPLPFRLELAAGIAAIHPARTKNNETIMWPIFVQSFGSNRAAAGYGRVFIELSGTY